MSALWNAEFRETVDESVPRPEGKEEWKKENTASRFANIASK